MNDPYKSADHLSVVDDEFEDSAVLGGRRGLIGKYQLCFQLASGGMARVYLARVQGPGNFEKLVALKRIHSHLADQPEFVEMFLDEARIASRINHPNVCQVFDFGQDGGSYYIAMEFLLGETAGRAAGAIAKTEQAGSERWARVCARVCAEAAEGLHAAHELKGSEGESLEVVHRDVSPHNLFITYDGAVTVVDFGIASARDRLHTTNAGTLKGRYAYMAPELVQTGVVNRQTDVWALGVTFWEMLTGKRLFKRKNDAETIMATVYGPVPPPSALRENIPKQLDAVVEKALAREPEERFATTRDFGRALSKALMEIGEPTGKPEIAELMEGLFEERHSQRLVMIEQARVMQSGVIRRSPVDESLAEELENAESIDLPPEPTRARRRRRRTGVVGVALGIVGGVAATLLLMLAITGDEPTERPGAVAEAVVVPEPGGEPTPGEPEEHETGEESSEEVPAHEDGDTLDVPNPEASAPPEEVEGEAVVVEVVAEPEPPRMVRRRKWRGMAVRGPPGTVSVVTPGGWADIFHGGRRLGRTPARVQLPAGRQVLSLRPFGTQSARRVPVVVPAGGTARASLRVSR